MALSTAVSVASFSVVLAETFAAVSLSTLIPAGVVTMARLAKQFPKQLRDQDGNPVEETPEARAKRQGPLTEAAGAVAATPAKAAAALVNAVGESLPSLDLLLPKTAKIRAEFEFEGAERYEASVEVGALVKVVNIAAGYSALYETSSRNKITLEVDFVSVNVPI